MTKKSGFSLLELIIYLGIFAGIALFIGGTFISITQGGARAEARYAVNSNLDYALQRIAQDAKDSDSVSNVIGSSSARLNLNVAGSTITYYISDDNILMRQATTAGVSDSPTKITSENVKVSSAVFNVLPNVDVASNKASYTVDVTLTLSYRSPSPEYAYSETQSRSVLLSPLFVPQSRGTFGSPVYGQGGYGGGCFLANTKILMADGSLKSIENIRAGDYVMSYSLDRNQQIPARVISLLIHPFNNTDYLIINGMFKVTINHRVWFKSGNDAGDYRRVEQIAIGDLLKNSNGKLIKVNSLRRVSGNKNIVYNLELGGEDHNFFADDILVHNSLLARTTYKIE